MVARQEFTCQHCNATFTRTPSQIYWATKREFQIRFCSKVCMGSGHTGSLNSHWSGGKSRTSHGYVTVSDKNNRQYEHIQVAESALGHDLPALAVVHHHDGDGTNNSNTNLVICENQRYHLLLHYRQRMFHLGANPSTQKLCGSCKQVKLLDDFPDNKRHFSGKNWQCRRCYSLKWAACDNELERRKAKTR